MKNAHLMSMISMLSAGVNPGRTFRGYNTDNLIKSTGSYNKSPADPAKKRKRKAQRLARKRTRQSK